MTEVAIEGERFLINGEVTYRGRRYRGWPLEGLLLNSRMVQATFDDANPATRARWAYPDTGLWDPERNTDEFVRALPTYREHGLLAVTVNFQGGSPEGYSRAQPWDNSGFTPDGELRPAYGDRMARVLRAADGLGMGVILGLFYFGQDERLRDEASVVRAADGAAEWVLENGWRHVLIEVNNECDVPRYEHEILRPARVSELIERLRGLRRGGRRLLVGTSYGGGAVPDRHVAEVSDFLLLHGNGVGEPDRIARLVDAARAASGDRPVPILFNEDDHFDFEKDWNNFFAAVSRGASWGYFDPGKNDYCDGFQCPPVNWGLSTERKRAFFGLVRRMTAS